MSMLQQHRFIHRWLRLLAMALCGLAWIGQPCAQGQATGPGTTAKVRVPPSSGGTGASAKAAFRIRVVGGLEGTTQYTQLEAPFWTRDLSRLSDGRFSADIVPFDRAGVPGMEMLRLLQLGVVPFGTALMSSFSAQYPQYTAPDLAGLNPTMEALRASVQSFRPYLERALRADHRIELLALYTYPAQIIFCKRPMARLSDLSGRRVRVSSPAQASVMVRLGASPVLIPFAQLRRSLESGETECAVTGSMSGNTVGLHTLTSYLYPMPLSWGLSIFGANRDAWAALPPELRQLLRTELPRLEDAIWRQAASDTAGGIACNIGQPECRAGTPGYMALVPVSEQDDRLRQEIFNAVVLPHWLRRCTVRCADIWNQTVGPARGIAAPAIP